MKNVTAMSRTVWNISQLYSLSRACAELVPMLYLVGTYVVLSWYLRCTYLRHVVLLYVTVYPFNIPAVLD